LLDLDPEGQKINPQKKENKEFPCFEVLDVLF
jgi:hypothetical protein